jgi:hypothetical protein
MFNFIYNLQFPLKKYYFTDDPENQPYIVNLPKLYFTIKRNAKIKGNVIHLPCLYIFPHFNSNLCLT